MLNCQKRLPRLCAVRCALVVVVLAMELPTWAQKMTTSQYDNGRTGANLKETSLTPRNVNASQFGKLFTLKVDEDVCAQPLLLDGVEIPGRAGTMCSLSQRNFWWRLRLHRLLEPLRLCA
jgi:hypothetical protein